MITGLVLLLVAAAQNPDSARAVYARQMRIRMGAYEMGRACRGDNRREPEAVAAELARRFSDDSVAADIASRACLAALTGGSYAWSPPPPPPAPQPRKVFAPRLPGPFGTYNWVFWADVALAGALGMIAAYVRARRRESRHPGWWIALGGIVGGISGAVIFLPLAMLAMLFMFLSPPGGRELFALSVIVIVAGFLGAVMELTFWKNRPSFLSAKRWNP